MFPKPKITVKKTTLYSLGGLLPVNLLPHFSSYFSAFFAQRFIVDFH